MKSKLKILFGLTLIITAICLLCAPPPAKAAGWSAGYGMGVSSLDDTKLSGSGAPLAVITSVQSNSLYYITSAAGAGPATINSTLFKSDLVASTLKWYAATSSYTIASNAVANTNILWLQGTNAGLATNDILVLQDPNAGDSYQLLVLSGNATDSAGLVYTNDAGYTAVKLFTTVTNASAGSKLWKMSAIATFSPLALGITNVFAFQATNATSPCGQWMPLQATAFTEPIRFRAPSSVPTALVLTYSNAAGLYVQGEYDRPRRN